MGSSLQDLGLNAEQASDRLQSLFATLNSGVNLRTAIIENFNDLLSQYDPNSDE